MNVQVQDDIDKGRQEFHCRAAKRRFDMIPERAEQRLRVHNPKRQCGTAPSMPSHRIRRLAMSVDRNSAPHPQPTDADELAGALADTLEAIEWLERFERPYLLARYQANLGELEVRLLGLKVEHRAYRSRVDLGHARLRRGEPLSSVALAAIERAVASEVLAWQALEADHTRVLAESQRHPGGRPPLDRSGSVMERRSWLNCS